MKPKYQLFLEWTDRKQGKITVLEAHEKVGASKNSIRMVIKEDLMELGMLTSFGNKQRRYYTKNEKWNLEKAIAKTRARLKAKALKYKKRRLEVDSARKVQTFDASDLGKKPSNHG